MKKEITAGYINLIFVVTILVMLIACNETEQENKLILQKRNDSIRIADSITVVKKNAEIKAKNDSIKTINEKMQKDSIEKAKLSIIPKTVKDIDGNIYKTVVIGEQVWMKSNLRTTHYRNGDKIAVISESELIDFGNKTPGYTILCGDKKTISIYGLQYNGYAPIDPRCLCPVGWHIPSKKEWEQLIKFLGGKKVAGGKMKEAGAKDDSGSMYCQIETEKGKPHWCSPNRDATNSSQFTALPAGRYSVNVGYEGIFWSSTVKNKDALWVCNIWYSSSGAYMTDYSSGYASSVRCIMDKKE